MIVEEAVRIRCDVEECSRSFPPRGFTPRATLPSALKAAKWTVTRDGDYCPNHTPPEAT